MLSRSLSLSLSPSLTCSLVHSLAITDLRAGASFCLSSCHVLYAECFFMPLFLPSPSPSLCILFCFFVSSAGLESVRKEISSSPIAVDCRSNQVQPRINKSTKCINCRERCEWTKDQQVTTGVDVDWLH